LMLLSCIAEASAPQFIALNLDGTNIF
jgi:hypothetical protein